MSDFISHSRRCVPRVDSGAVRIGPLRFLTGGSKSRTEMTYYVSSGTLNPTHTLTHSRPCVCVALVATPVSQAYIHCVSKNDADVAHYNFNAHQPILVFFGRNVAERAYYQMVICYPIFPN